MSRGPDAAVLLERTLIADAARSAVMLEVTAGKATRWASATFVGARHALTLSAARDLNADTWIGELEDAELPVRGHLVADVQVVRIVRADGRVVADVEVLTVEEG
ncbi:hypothetical protein M9980_13410 [Sphingomonas donggukensis]|uniref:Uncharacterized protein n=1 Tax=Sphingomonas donggukensis TaxID=2949093 RepID=A0ABY4TSY2_9SPHN|nr:hypothetical protein [Sphingomonas donggukensis]URW75509.1 hypothetical protein M9980_13410 [Sphingomonas donggukensis]